MQTESYAYGKANLEMPGDASVAVTRMACGRWEELPEMICSCPRTDVQGQTVRSVEAASGIGTYVGNCGCVARLLPGSAKVRSYGVVTDYTWNRPPEQSILHVCFGADTSSIDFNTSELQVFPFPVYAMRRCASIPALTLLGAEMRRRHEAIPDHFNGTGCRASRNSASILRKVGSIQVDESSMVKVFDFSRCYVQSTSIKYVLDFSYYHGNNRRRLRSVSLGATILDDPSRTIAPVTQTPASGTTPASRATPAVSTAILPGQLSDSDDSDDEEPDLAPAQGAQKPSNIERLSIMHLAPVTESFRRDYAASHDMADFSRTMALPPAATTTDLGSIIDALNVLAASVARVGGSAVGLRPVFTSGYIVCTYYSDHDCGKHCRVTAAPASSAGGKTSPSTGFTKSEAPRDQTPRFGRSTRVPQVVLSALPKLNGKSLKTVARSVSHAPDSEAIRPQRHELLNISSGVARGGAHSAIGQDEFLLFRGETQEDTRPNKALAIPSHLSSWSTYKYRKEWENIVKHGVRAVWKTNFQPQTAPPANHASAIAVLNSLIEQIRKGQDAGHYLVLDLYLLPHLEGFTCSPFGAVEKDPASTPAKIRAIHDLSYPEGILVNDNTADDTSVIVNYDGPPALAQHILHVQAEFPNDTIIMSGDVSGAFKHIPIHTDHIGRFATTLSPQHYWTAGAAISHIHASSRPTWLIQPIGAAQLYDAETWCDDHNLIEPDVGTRLAEANNSPAGSQNIAELRQSGSGDYGINLRELVNAVFTSIAWGSRWAGGTDPGYIKETLANLGALLRAGAIADSSRTHYKRYWNQWGQWCRWIELSVWFPEADMNGNVTQLGAFVVFLWRYGMNNSAQGNTYSTLCAKLCAIRWYHRNYLGYDPGVNASHAILLRGVRRFTRPVAKLHPLSAALFRVIASSLDL
ncbi:hypothetical protein ON010_g7447 [Phytophthora cinnamomi]|nr:hypothetical protein ON010_g7447 [Phytophthora cinnamomi]